MKSMWILKSDENSPERLGNLSINKEHWRNATNMLERCDVSKPQSEVFY